MAQYFYWENQCQRAIIKKLYQHDANACVVKNLSMEEKHHIMTINTFNYYTDDNYPNMQLKKTNVVAIVFKSNEDYSTFMQQQYLKNNDYVNRFDLAYTDCNAEQLIRHLNNHLRSLKVHLLIILDYLHIAEEVFKARNQMVDICHVDYEETMANIDFHSFCDKTVFYSSDINENVVFDRNIMGILNPLDKVDAFCNKTYGGSIPPCIKHSFAGRIGWYLHQRPWNCNRYLCISQELMYGGDFHISSSFNEVNKNRYPRLLHYKHAFINEKTLLKCWACKKDGGIKYNNCCQYNIIQQFDNVPEDTIFTLAIEAKINSVHVNDQNAFILCLDHQSLLSNVMPKLFDVFEEELIAQREGQLIFSRKEKDMIAVIKEKETNKNDIFPIDLLIWSYFFAFFIEIIVYCNG